VTVYCLDGYNVLLVRTKGKKPASGVHPAFAEGGFSQVSETADLRENLGCVKRTKTKKPPTRGRRRLEVL